MSAQPIIIRTETLKEEVHYTVERNGILWSRIVEFGYGPNRPAGQAFKEAARAQEAFAARLKKQEDVTR